MMGKIIGSYSGAIFEIVGNSITKYANANLADSAVMQMRYNLSRFRTPKIHSYGRGFIKMDYIDCMPGFEYLTQDNIKKGQIEAEINFIASAIDNNFDREIVIDDNIIKDKIKNIRSRLRDEEDLYLCDLVTENTKPTYEIYSGDYHGDLTLSNILYRKRDHARYLIDFLPGYIYSPILDIVKLRQEYKLKWSQYLVTKMLPSKYNLVCNIIEDVLKANKLDTGYEIFEAINYLRILPYAKTQEVSNALRKEIKKLL